MIIGLTGRIAAGKGCFVDYLLEKDFDYATISRLVREELALRGLEVTRKNLQDVGNHMRESQGADVWIRRLVSSIEASVVRGEHFIVDGIRNPVEVQELRKMDAFFLIAFDAPQDIRFKRVLSRAKSSDPTTWEGFVEIDERDFCERDRDGSLVESGQQVGACMALADFLIVNDSTLEHLKLNIDSIFLEIENNFISL